MLKSYLHLRHSQHFSALHQQRINALTATQHELAALINRELGDNPALEETYDDVVPDNPATPIDEIENDIPQMKTLADSLIEQLAFVRDEPLKVAAMEIIYNLDESGYYKDEVKNLEALKLVQSLSPTGVGARDLKECLKLQLLEKGHKEDSGVIAVLDYLPALAGQQFHVISRILQKPEEEIAGYLEEIRTLVPRPVAAYSAASPVCTVTDVLVDAALQCHLILPDMPRLTLSANAVRGIFMDSWRLRARNLINSIKQRHQTLLRVTREIVNQQKEFFRGGELKAMTICSLATTVKIHEANVGRALIGKFIQCSRGRFPMRSFFCSGVGTDAGDMLAATAIQDRIRQIVAKETYAMSDPEITRRLNAEGIHIARRTVTKYRIAAGVLPYEMRSVKKS